MSMVLRLSAKRAVVLERSLLDRVNKLKHMRANQPLLESEQHKRKAWLIEQQQTEALLNLVRKYKGE